jgi:dihydrolipoamide dehydrogenase
MSDAYDVIVIGGGTGGYPAAIRAAQLGMKVACVERRETLGGTCLNVGCIPSKALLQSTELYSEVAHGMEEHGIGIAGVALNLAQLLARKDKVVGDLTKGVEYLFRKNKVEWVKGSARFKDARTLAVELNDGGARALTASKGIIVATGSDVATLPGVIIDEERIVSSTGALALPEVPKHLAVIGGGYIGLELGSVWRRLGAEVTVIEYFDRIVPAMDGEIAAQLHKVLRTQGLAFRLGTKVTRMERREGGVTLDLEPAAGGAPETIEADVVLLAIGRRPYSEGLGLDEVSVERDDKGRIPVDARFRTNIEGIYAVGDVIPGPMLAHKTTEDGIACVEGIAGHYARVDYDKIPAVIYTWPEVASVGKTEEELEDAGVEYKKGMFPFSANSRARVNGDTTGLVKVLTDARNDTLLGVHIIGPDAGTMIPEAVLALEFGASAEDIALTVHAHPTLPEAIREAALAARGRAMHI